MKKIEKLFTKIGQYFLDNAKPSLGSLMVLIFCWSTSMLIFKYRKKDEEDILDQKIFNDYFGHIDLK